MAAMLAGPSSRLASRLKVPLGVQSEAHDVRAAAKSAAWSPWSGSELVSADRAAAPDVTWRPVCSCIWA